MKKYICIHGHFYQPPRENPWLEEIELQDSAYPYHDWNEKITAECYSPNSSSRVMKENQQLVDIVNNYIRMSYNFGPTLLSWMKRKAPDAYQSIIEADKSSADYFNGHGSAIAQPYNHMIMPLANIQDKVTQIIWGIRDFELHYNRKPEGMWLPETAVDLETLDIMANHAIKFTILSQNQAHRIRQIGKVEWQDVSGNRIDPKRVYQCQLPSGRTIALFFYDGPIARDVNFRGLLRNGAEFAQRMAGSFKDNEEYPQIVHIATDGETFGHHHRFGDMAVAYCFYHIEANNIAKITNYAEYLELYPPKYEVQIYDNSSWSCVHGVERWKDDCGCNTGNHQGWSQVWRKPLREAMDWLRDQLIPLFVKHISPYFYNPWDARNDYIEVINNRTLSAIEFFLQKHSKYTLNHEERIKTLKLLEIQRHAMLMYTSCGWFFDDISGIEAVQVLTYAARALQLAREVANVDLEPAYLDILRDAPCNISEFKNGTRIYELLIKPSVVTFERLAAHYAISSLFEDYDSDTLLFCYHINDEIREIEVAGKQKLAIGNMKIQSTITLEDSHISYAVIHFGEHNLNGGVRKFEDLDSFRLMQNEIKAAFIKCNFPDIIRLMDKYFGTHNYSLWHLFKDKQRKIMESITEAELRGVENIFRQIFEQHYPIINVMLEMRMPLPKVLSSPAEFILNIDLRNEIESERLDKKRIAKIMYEFSRWKFNLDKRTLNYVTSQKVEKLINLLSNTPDNLSLLKDIEEKIGLLCSLPLELDIWHAQNKYFKIGKKMLPEFSKKADNGNNEAQEWLEYFNRISSHLRVIIA